MESLDSIYKVFSLEDLLQKKDKLKMMESFKKELGIAKDAKAKNLENIVQIRAIHIGSDHIALELPRYEMNLRQYYTQRRRKPKQL